MIADRDRLEDPAEVVVIGAGPAGASAATALARAGRRVLLVDRARFPRDKVCGCCLAPGGIAALRALALDELVASGHPLAEVTLRAPSGTVDLPFTGSIVLGRDRLDTALVEAAIDAGVEMAFETTAKVEADDTVTLSAIGTPIGTASSTVHRPLAVIVADGLGGRALERPAFDWRVRPQGRFGAGVVVKSTPDAPPPGSLWMLADRTGYLGVVRLPDDRIDLAAAFDARAVRASGGPAGAAARLLRTHDRPEMAAVAAEARWKGTPTLTRHRRTVAAGRVLCIGDAAAYVEPFTGEGMTWALESGIEAARFTHQALAASTSLDEWNRRHARLFAAKHRRCRFISTAVSRPDLVRRIARLVAMVPRGRDTLARLVTGATRPAPLPRGATS